MNPRILRLVTAIVVFLGSFLTFANEWLPEVSALFPRIAHSGPFIIGIMLATYHFLMWLGDYLDDGKINNSFHP